MNMNLKPVLASGFAALLLSGVAVSETTSPQMQAVEQVADSVITEKVKAAIEADPALATAEISIETIQGVVQLNGYVGSSADIQKAAAIAQNVAGVKSVKNDLKTK